MSPNKFGVFPGFATKRGKNKGGKFNHLKRVVYDTFKSIAPHN